MDRRQTLLLSTLLALGCGENGATPVNIDGAVDAGTPVADGPRPADGPLAVDGPLAADGPLAIDAPPAADAPPAGDTAPARDAGFEVGGARPVRFSLRNDTGQIIYLQAGAFWGLSRDGQLLPAEDTCEYCNCPDPGCAVCGKPLDMTIAIAAGASQTWEWAGLQWLLRDRGLPGVPGLQCEDPVAVAPGPLQLRVTYSLSKMDEPPESRIGPALKQEMTFQHPPPGEVLMILR